LLTGPIPFSALAAVTTK